MRFSTIQIHNQSLESILKQQAALTKTQTQIASGKRVETPADDPLSASSILLLKDRLRQNNILQENTNFAENRLQLSESTLEAVTSNLQRIKELQVRAASGALSKDDRTSIVNEIITLRDELVGLANTRDENGDFIYAGFKSGAQAFTQDSSGNYVYNGDNGQRFMQIQSGLQIPISDSGFEIFENIPEGNGFFTIEDPGATNTGSVTITPGTVDRSTYVADTYTITFVTNSAGETAYQVVGAASGQLIPALPAVIPDDAPAYIEGNTIQFNGVQVRMEGTPQVGDNFQVTPSAKRSLLNTVNDIINALQAPIETAAQRAAATNQLTQSFAALDQGFNNVLQKRAQLGARLNQIDSSQVSNESFEFFTKEVLTSLEDLDMADAITRLELQSTALQAAQQSYLRIQNLSIFNFLR